MFGGMWCFTSDEVCWPISFTLAVAQDARRLDTVSSQMLSKVRG
jgi:hypothetical protein